jgi:MFS family permease
VIVDLIGFGIVMPVLPFYAEAFGASGGVFGGIMMTYAAAQFACAPLWGRLSDRVGRRPVLLLTIAGEAASLLALALADSLVAILVARALGGAFAANLSVASAYIADVTPEQERTRWMALLGACFGVGFVLGPLIGGVLSPYGHRVPLLAAAGLAVANGIHALLRLREPPAHVAVAGPEALADDPEGQARRAMRQGRFAPLREPLVRRLCLANLAFSMAVAQLETMFPYFMLHRFGWQAREVGFLMAAMAVVMGGVQGGGMKALAARVAERSLVIAGSLLLAVAFAALPAAPTVALLLGPLTLCALGRAVAQPALMSMASLAAPPERRGAVMGAFQSSASLARVVGPLAAGLLYDWWLAAPFALASALLLGVASLARGLPARVAEGEAFGEPRVA